ncbi:ATP-binding protein [Mycobacterium sp. 134]|uniref:ATP-binding protein n=1 Tax=Mycobacterium sp. 134 TaxID=3400425 RepID=UPI003AAA8BB3
MAAQDNSRSRRLEKTILLGELALDGRVRPVRGVLPAVLAAKQAGWSAIVVPAENLAQGGLGRGHGGLGVLTLGQMIAWLDTGRTLDPGAAIASKIARSRIGFPTGSGRLAGGQAVEVAAAGCHHMLLVGQDSSATAAIAHRLVAVLPDLNDEEALEMLLHSVAAMMEAANPGQSPDHSWSPPAASSVGARGRGWKWTCPSLCYDLAHRGVLFLEVYVLLEMGVSAMEAMTFRLEDARSGSHGARGGVLPSTLPTYPGDRQWPGRAAGSQTDCIRRHPRGALQPCRLVWGAARTGWTVLAGIPGFDCKAGSGRRRRW